ncbi:MAG TPA: hypothetical protein VNM38_13440 [Solirubrobacterales bacterium]|nr:hypothetical protein [Solirubrobacterales bacterium]
MLAIKPIPEASALAADVQKSLPSRVSVILWNDTGAKHLATLCRRSLKLVRDPHDPNLSAPQKPRAVFRRKISEALFEAVQLLPLDPIDISGAILPEPVQRGLQDFDIWTNSVGQGDNPVLLRVEPGRLHLLYPLVGNPAKARGTVGSEVQRAASLNVEMPTIGKPTDDVVYRVIRL